MTVRRLSCGWGGHDRTTRPSSTFRRGESSEREGFATGASASAGQVLCGGERRQESGVRSQENTLQETLEFDVWSLKLVCFLFPGVSGVGRSAFGLPPRAGSRLPPHAARQDRKNRTKREQIGLFRPASISFPTPPRLPPDVRTSRLAILSLIVAILGCPCLLGAISNWINWYVPAPFNQVGRYGFIHFDFVRGTMILAAVLPVVSAIRILLSNGTRTGLGIALSAVVIAGVWWGLTAMMDLAWRGFSPS